MQQWINLLTTMGTELNAVRDSHRWLSLFSDSAFSNGNKHGH